MRDWCNIKGRSKWTTQKHNCNNQIDIMGFDRSDMTYVHRDFEDKKLKADDLGMRAQACCDELTCTVIADRAMVDR